VVKIDDRTIGTGRPGTKTRALMAILKERTARYSNPNPAQSDDMPASEASA
jgi:hypothetical protein